MILSFILPKAYLVLAAWLLAENQNVRLIAKDAFAANALLLLIAN